MSQRWLRSLYCKKIRAAKPNKGRFFAIWTVKSRPYWQVQNGFQLIINFAISVRAANKAMIIATAVRTPNKIVGMKLESTKIENPTVIVIVV